MNKTMPNAKYFFLELGIIASLYISIVSFITFAFSIIDYIFPDRLANNFDPYAGGIRFAISTLIIVFPIFIVLSRIMWKALLQDVESRSLPIRKWLTYLTLFIAGAAIAGDLITLVNTFLNGEVSERFIVKILVVLIVSGAVFFYSIKDLKGVFYDVPGLFKKVMIGTSLVVLLSIIGGFFIIGLPASQRDLRDDMTRSGNLQSIQWEVVNYYQRTGKLPATTNELIDPLYPQNAEYHKDPATQKPYEYRTIASSTPTFELCADFALASKTSVYDGRGGYPSGFSPKYSQVDYSPINIDPFEHVIGRNCFIRIIDPARYPKYPDEGGKPMPL